MTDPRRQLPSMDALLKEREAVALIDRYGRETVKDSLRRALDRTRAEAGPEPSGAVDLLRAAERDLEARSRPSLRRALNGTGVVLHTNLGRAPLADAAGRAQAEAAGYGNVELSLSTGRRGSRYDHCSDVVCELTGAAAAIIANNNAAAVALVVNELARGREVLVSRGELVEIGGSFRIPDVVGRSGGRLREVGTTNRTRISDYAAAIDESTGLILRVHPSNYRVEGFSARPSLAALVSLARERGVPLAHDLGSGLLDADLLPGFPEGPTARGSLAAGVDLATWSGDKLLGGPQAGVIAGDAALIGRLRRNPLLRAFRVDKTTLAALEATLMLYRDPDLAVRRVPALRMLREPAEAVEARAAAARLEPPPRSRARVDVIRTEAMVGGGAFPGFTIPSAGWAVTGIDVERLAAECRTGLVPLIGRIERAAFIVDVRTLPGEETARAAETLASALDRLADV
ncbi:L-seryl-tRNA(Sec) selenium transferase [Candidatus Palauibacter soopunensis]|uniref:L-seryl-tRNA(Sec) selenium transferase n=1 Tax=Candidatus Palauibacter soopunensis TaxID=3056739 RepID=UPI002395D252|nr:L-seryl-tRNA(Sec) selenium transferase [Candidatus Palauibacter soopunensis]MDE2879756.1 L-seryl-tRNA(Sec) selenium transferase [Candidatus Palauibacter soopunensis]